MLASPLGCFFFNSHTLWIDLDQPFVSGFKLCINFCLARKMSKPEMFGSDCAEITKGQMTPHGDAKRMSIPICNIQLSHVINVTFLLACRVGSVGRSDHCNLTFISEKSIADRTPLLATCRISGSPFLNLGTRKGFAVRGKLSVRVVVLLIPLLD